MDEMFAIKCQNCGGLCTHTRLNAALSAPIAARSFRGRPMRGEPKSALAFAIRH